MARTFVSARARGLSTREEGVPLREQKQAHVPVMADEVAEALVPKRGEVIVDATYGQGGHSRALGKSGAEVIALDADPSAGVIEANFADLEKVLKKLGVAKIDKIVFDLGWNRGQLSSGRGFSFMRDEPLLMSYGPSPRSGFFAKDILNAWSEQAIADALFGYGEERYARRIAKAIAARRARKTFATTFELVEVIRAAVPRAYARGRLHPATRTFQALRIAVNEELKVLEQGLRAAWKHLACGGRIAVISFHSVEDRIVKNLFRRFNLGEPGSKVKSLGRLIYKKPLVPSAKEIAENPAARSAKLRAIEKTCK